MPWDSTPEIASAEVACQSGPRKPAAVKSTVLGVRRQCKNCLSLTAPSGHATSTRRASGLLELGDAPERAAGAETSGRVIDARPVIAIVIWWNT